MADSDELGDEIKPVDEDKKNDVIAEGEPTAPAEVSTQEGVEDLKRKLVEAQQQAHNANLQRQAAIEFAQRQQAYSGQVVENSQLALVSSGLDRAKQEADLLEGAIATASSEGDHARVAKLTRSLSQTEAKILTLETGKDQLERQARQPQPQPQQQQQIQPIPQDPVEALAANRTPRTQAWIREHADWIRDDRKRGQVFNAHNIAVSGGLREDSDEYFSEVERILGLAIPGSRPIRAEAEPTADAPLSSASAPVQARQSAPSAAPTSRSGNGGGVNKSGQKSLSKAEREAADDSGVDYNTYWEYKYGSKALQQ